MTNLLSDKTNKVLVSMSLPISIGMLSTFLFQVIDTFFVGQLGPESLAALSFASTVYFLLVGLFMGLSVGVSVIVGKAMGAQTQNKVRKTSWIALSLSFTMATGFAFLIYILLDPIFSLLGAEAHLLPLIGLYLRPLLLGIPLLTLGIVGGGILRSTGTVKLPELIMGIAGVINLVFDYGLIFGKWGLPELGIRGAALATVLSWIFVLVGMLILLIKEELLAINWDGAPSSISIIKEIFHLGTPTILTQIIGPLTLIFITYLLATESGLAVAAFGVAGRVETLLMIGILGVSTAITPFIAQNFGAQQTKRIEEAIAFGGRASSYLGVLVAILLFLFIKPIAKLFSNDTAVITYTAYYFYLVALSYASYGLYLITTSIFNGLELPFNSMKISIVKSFLLTIPLTYIGSYWGVYGIFVGLAISNFLAGFYAAYIMKKQLIKVESNLAKVKVWQEYLKDFQRIFRYIKAK